MKRTITITALLILISIGGKAQIIPDTITICFQLASKAKGEQATLVYPDFIGGRGVSLHPITDSNGRWAVKIPTYRTLHIKIWDNNKIEGVVWTSLNLFCNPGSKVDILLDDVNDRCIFTGDNAEAHQAQITHPLKIEDFHGKMFSMDMQSAATHIRSIQKQNLYRIDTLYAAHPKLPSRYVDGLRAVANYGYAMDMTQNVFGHYAESIAQFISEGNKLPQEYVDLLHEVETCDLMHPQEFLSRDAISYFTDIVNIEDIVRNGILRETSEQTEDEQLNFFKSICSVIDSIDVSTEIKDLMKIWKSLQTFQNEMTPEREKFICNQLTADAFAQLQNYLNGMKALLEENIQEVSTSTLADTPIDSLINGKDIFQKLITPYRGRVIYVDVWGTWCGPCIREMEHLPQLHEALEGLPVTYMYLANKSPEELWKKSAKRFGLEGKDCLNLCLPNKQQHAVEDYLGVSGFPTFLIVGPDGTIVTNKAPRPSNPSGVRDAIMKLIEKTGN